MSSTKNNHPIVLDAGRSQIVWTIAFHPDGKHLLSGSQDGLRWRRCADGEEVGKQMGMDVGAISVSRDCKWIVCGATKGASVWDEKIQEKAIDVEGTKYVGAVDVSPDAIRFATGTGEADNSRVNSWNIVTGKRLVGPLKHGSNVIGVKFSPNGERMATACWDSLQPIRIFDSHNGNQLKLITFKVSFKSGWLPVIPLAWSDNGQQIFVASGENKIIAFNSSIGSQLAESLAHNDDDDSKVVSIALATNGKFLSTFTGNSILVWDTSTLAQVNLPIKDSGAIQSIALSPDCSYVATGTKVGKIMIRNLSDILPDSYGPFRAPTQEDHDLETPQDGPQDTSGAHNDNAPDLTPEQPTTPSMPGSENQGEVGEGDLLEAEVPTGVPAPLFDYDEALSLASSTHLHEGEVALPGSSQALPHLPDALPMTYPPEAPCAEEHHDTAEWSGSIPMVKRWLQMVMRRGDKNQGSHQPDQLLRESVRPANPRSSSNSSMRGNTASEGPSRMAAAQRRLRTVAKSIQQEPPPKQTPDTQPKTETKTTETSHSNKDTSNSRQGHADPKTAGPVQKGNIASQPSAATGVHVTEEAGDARVSIAFKLPGWMCCFGTGAEDGKH